MATVKHPIRGRPTLAWDRVGAVFTAYTEAQAKYTRGNAYVVRETFAVVRPLYDALGLFTDGAKGWVVTRNNFDEIREFDDYNMAKLYVESLFTLEHGA
jgi:hypothetical protein